MASALKKLLGVRKGSRATDSMLDCHTFLRPLAYDANPWWTPVLKLTATALTNRVAVPVRCRTHAVA